MSSDEEARELLREPVTGFLEIRKKAYLALRLHRRGLPISPVWIPEVREVLSGLPETWTRKDGNNRLGGRVIHVLSQRICVSPDGFEIFLAIVLLEDGSFGVLWAHYGVIASVYPTLQEARAWFSPRFTKELGLDE